MSCCSDRPEAVPNPEGEDLVPRSAWERSAQALAAYEREESHTDPSSSEVQPEGSESSIPEHNVSTVLTVLPKEEDVFCSLNPPDAIPGPPMHPRTPSLPASSATSHHGSDGTPLLHSTSTSASNAAFLGHKSGQALPPVEHAASNEQTLEHISRAIKQDLRKFLCPIVHFTINYWETGPTTGCLVFIAHWAVNNGSILCRRQAVMIMCEAEQSNLTEIILQRVKRARDKWFHPMQLQVGYVVTPTMAVPQAVGDCCLGWFASPVDCLGQLIKGVMEKVRNEDFLILWVWQVLCKVSIHFEQSPVAHKRLRELQLLCRLPQELLHEKMPKPSNNLFLFLEFLLARRKAFSALEPEIPGLFFTRQDWCLMRHLACLLKPFEETITAIQKEDANLGQVLPELQLLEDKVKRCFLLLQHESDVTVSAAATRFATELLKSLENHSKLGIDRENLLYQTATLLHPCFRDHIHKYLKGDIEKKKWELKVWVTQQIEKEYFNLSSVYVTPSLTETASQELESYLQDNIDPAFLHMDPLVYWIKKRDIWPSLSMVAFRYFSCPPAPLILREGLGIEDLMIAGRCELTPMRSLGDRPEEATNPEVEDLVPRSPWERSPQALATYQREESHTVPPSSEVQPEGRESAIPEVQPEGSESSIPELNVSAVPSVLPEEGEAFCSVGQLDAIPGPPMHPRGASLSISSTKSYDGSDADPMLHYTSASASNAAFLGHQSGQVSSPAAHAASNELDLEHNISRAIEQGLKRSLCPVVHFTIDVRSTGPATGYMFIKAHWVVDYNFRLRRCQAVMLVCEVELSNLTEIVLHRLKEVRDKWLRPLHLQVGYVATPTMAVAQAVGECCLGWVASPIDCLGQLIKGVMEKVRNEDSLISWLWKVLCKVSTHFEQFPVAHDRLREFQLLCRLPQELLHEKMPTPSNNLFLLLDFLLARQKAFIKFAQKNTEFYFSRQVWRLMYYLVCLLKPFEETIITLSKENTNLGQVLPELQLLEEKVKGCFPLLQQESEVTVSAAATRFATELLKSLESTKDLGTGLRKDILYQTATLLHPYFRDHICNYLKEDGQQEMWVVKKWVTQQIEKGYLNFSSDDATSFLTEVASEELEFYLQDNIDLAQSHMDPLVYWNTKKSMWPSLSTVAFQYLSCPPAPVILREVLGIEDLIIPGRFQESLAFNRLNRSWKASEISDTGSQSIA
ncbi:uncharacterized protein LOC128323950 [Hemicordylus capensis]|uniref:uncharacterized protein LOC128323950 n=1 Tax=Hemicordylus capensis TaxID=884348 RepID=UPI00230415C6|nr:uncharacterized protein LOC128323950 [Hemicordylus capensis]